MKYLIILLLIPFVFFSQTEEPYKCNFKPIPRMYDASIFSQTCITDFDNEEPIVINVFFHIIKQQNGDDFWNTTEEDLLKLLANVNREFNTFKIFFKYKGFYNLHSNNYLADYTAIKTELVALGEYRTDAINVQISPNLFPQGNLTTIVWDNDVTQIDMVFRADTFTPENDKLPLTMPIHEFAHAMGLMHVFEGTTGGIDCNTTDGVDCLPNNSDCPIILDAQNNDTCY